MQKNDVTKMRVRELERDFKGWCSKQRQLRVRIGQATGCIVPTRSRRPLPVDEPTRVHPSRPEFVATRQSPSEGNSCVATSDEGGVHAVCF
ncbi:hypothetical protein KQX54_008672 [Cotesia glomerata]|uniref:Uncharacterized protein n=1 Tax=Cotesia glomerata TaxID=32391 RepID=A0AAV7HY48_COTGL|nr:hypothetical protein KQX54_008672 [Cotesia glomerata]